MKTKFIKVSVEDRLPEAEKELFIINSEEEIFHGYLSSRNNWIIYGLKNAGDIKYFLEEVPDREEEMRELLEKARIVIARMKRSMLVHPDHEEGSEFDDQTTSAQEMENEIGEYLLNK